MPPGPVLSFIGPASSLLDKLQRDDPLSCLADADLETLNLAHAFCGAIVRRLEDLGMALRGDFGPCHRPRVPAAAADQLFTVQDEEEEITMMLRPLANHQRHRQQQLLLLQSISLTGGGKGGGGGGGLHIGGAHTSSSAAPLQDGSSTAAAGIASCPLLDLPVDLVHSVCNTLAVDTQREGQVSLSMLSRTCTFFGRRQEEEQEEQEQEEQEQEEQKQEQEEQKQEQEKAQDETGQLQATPADVVGSTVSQSVRANSRFKGLSFVEQHCQDIARALGVRRLPVSLGSDWCWARMISWVSTAVRVDQHPTPSPPPPLLPPRAGSAGGATTTTDQLLDAATDAASSDSWPESGLLPAPPTTIREGLNLAWVAQNNAVRSGSVVPESTVLVLVEPGVYDESIQIVPGQHVHVWGCDRDAALPKQQQQQQQQGGGSSTMKKVEWRSRGDSALQVAGDFTYVGLNGLYLSAFPEAHIAEEVLAGDLQLPPEMVALVNNTFSCVLATSACKLTLECCDLTCGAADVVRSEGAQISVTRCCVQGGEACGIAIGHGGRAALVGNDIHSNACAGVFIFGAGSTANLTDNKLRDGSDEGIVVADGGRAILNRNQIHGNDTEGVLVHSNAVVMMGPNSIRDNGHARIERTEDELSTWVGDDGAEYYRSGKGFAGVRIHTGSSARMHTGLNDTTADNGKGVLQMEVDDSSRVVWSKSFDGRAVDTIASLEERAQRNQVGLGTGFDYNHDLVFAAFQMNLEWTAAEGVCSLADRREIGASLNRVKDQLEYAMSHEQCSEVVDFLLAEGYLYPTREGVEGIDGHFRTTF